MPPKPPNDFRLEDLLSLQTIRAHSQITIETDVRKELNVEIGDRLLLYAGPWENSVVIISIPDGNETDDSDPDSD